MFTGFSPETVDFLWGIRMNNNRDWFLAHKQQYLDALYEPMKELGQELFQPFQDRAGNLLKVSRIYRDSRLHHPAPYKESLWICIRREVDWWGENPCLFFEINPEGVDYGFFLWKPRSAAMKRFREELAARPEPFLELVAKVEAETGVPITANCYKRPVPTQNPALERFFPWRDQLGCTCHEDFRPETFSPELARRARSFLEQLIPLYDYFYRFGG